MTNNRDLLKEAIADAKAVKETAIANAKAALEEAFTPYLKEKLAAKLSEMDEEEVKESYDMEEGKKEMEEMKEKDMKENFDMDESEEMDEMYDEHPMSTKDALEKTDIDEMDLDELLRELDEMEENINGTDIKDLPHELGDHGNIVNIDEAESEDEEYKDEDADGVEDSEDAEIDLENMSEDDLKSFIEGVIADMVAAGELEGGHEGMEGEESGEEEESSEEEISIDELMSGLDEKKKYGGNKGDVPAAKRGDKKDTAEEEGVEDYKKKLKEMEAKLEEAYAAIETVKTDLNEVNLLNAKLLYTNKIFRAKNLTESQKVKVLAAFDKAATTKEAKLVFETLSEGLNEKKSSVNESMIGGASKVAGIAPTKKPILEINDQFARWQTLAGLKK
jgi:hypothetical protein